MPWMLAAVVLPAAMPSQALGWTLSCVKSEGAVSFQMASSSSVSAEGTPAMR